MRNIALPYLSLDDAEVTIGPWEYRVSGSEDWRPLRDFVPDWDYALRFRVRRSYEVGTAGLERLFGGAASDARLAIIVGLRSGAGRGSLAFELARAALDGRTWIEADVPSGVLAERMLLQSQIVTLGELLGRAPLTPARRGCRVWQDECAVRLAGREARLPMELASFADSHRPIARAPWFVHWTSGDWERDFMSAVVVLVNDDNAETREAIMRSDPAVLRQVMVDTVTDVVAGYLAAGDAVDRRAWPEGSLGHVAEAWLDILAGEEVARTQLRSWTREVPGMLRARVSHAFSGAGQPAREA